MPKKDIIGKRISPMLESYMERRSSYTMGTNKDTILISEEVPKEVAVMNPIIGAGDILGAVMLLCDEKKKTPGRKESHSKDMVIPSVPEASHVIYLA